MFVSKNRAYPSEVTLRCSTPLIPGLTLKLYISLERLAKDKHCSLFMSIFKIAIALSFVTLGFSYAIIENIIDK
jgi:hypothetical protein